MTSPADLYPCLVSQKLDENPHHAAFRILYDLQRREHAEIAMLVSRTGEILGWCADVMERYPRSRPRVTPAFRLASAFIDETKLLTDAYLYVTYRPTTACFGNIYSTKIARILYNIAPNAPGETNLDLMIYGYSGGDGVHPELYDDGLEIAADYDRPIVSPGTPAGFDRLELTHAVMGHQSFGPSVKSAPPGPVTSLVQHDLYIAVAMGLLSQVTRRRGFNKGNPVAAILVAKSTGHILSAGVNTNSSSSTLHAEVNCIQNFLFSFRKPKADEEYILYTSLESCPRCSGLFTFMFPGNKVYYARKDEGFATTALREGMYGCEQIFRPWSNEALHSWTSKPISQRRFAIPMIDTRVMVSGGRTVTIKNKDHKIAPGFDRAGKLIGVQSWRKPPVPSGELSVSFTDSRNNPDVAVIAAMGDILHRIKNKERGFRPPAPFTPECDQDIKTHNYCLEYLLSFIEFNDRLIRARNAI